MKSPRLRTSIYRLHAFLGLHVFGILALLFLSGTLLLFITEIQTAFTKDMQLDEPATSHSATPGQIYDAIKTFDPEISPAYISKSESRWVADGTFGRFGSGVAVTVWTHPDTGAVIGVTGQKNLRASVRKFHTHFMTDNKIGALLVGVFAVILVFFIVTGLVTYRRFWKGFFRAPPHHLGRRGWWGGVHRLTAVWVSPFLIITALTGVFYLGETLGVLGGGIDSPKVAEPRETVIPEGFNGALLDRAVEAVREVVPDMHIKLLDMPFNKEAGIKIYGPSDGLINLEHGNIVMVDPVTFQILGQFSTENLPTKNWMTQVNFSLHTGFWGGFFSRILWAVFGLLATFLCLSGAMVYASRVASGPDGASRTAAGRIWHGMSLLKWGLVLFVIAVVGLAIVQFAL